MFNKISKMKRRHQTLFAILIGVAVVSFWRGVWGLLDEYLFPNHYEISLWISLIAGFAILVATHYITEELM